MAKAKRAVPEGFHTVTPQLTLDNAAQAIEWYKKAFGAEELSRSPGPDGKIMHAEIRIGDSRIMLNDPVMGEIWVQTSDWTCATPESRRTFGPLCNP